VAPLACGRNDPIEEQMLMEDSVAAPAERRRRNAGTTRERLLKAAIELFAERGFDRATVRDIGERAGVDPALIARYFGGKTELYIETLQNRSDTLPGDLLDSGRLGQLIDRLTRQHPGPILQAAVRSHDDDKAQSAAIAELHRRLISPLRERFVREGRSDPELRAEVIVAAFIGISLARSIGTLTELANSDPEVLIPMVSGILSGGLD
jgi:AcrR family transcriptional regulator